MILPYVYLLVNKETEEFYYGYRYKNVMSDTKSEEDLGIKYFTSSNYINKHNFKKFTATIIAEFFDKTDAYWFEQQLIKDNIKNPLLLNRHYQDPATGIKEFVNLGHSVETKKKMTGKKRSEDFREYRRQVMIGHTPWNKGLSKENDARVMLLATNRKAAGNKHQIGMKYSQERVDKVRKKLTGRVVPDNQKQKMSKAKKGKTWEEIFGPEEAARKRQLNKSRTGANHPGSRPISTPEGIFPSVTAAVNHFKVAEVTIRKRCLNTNDNWKDWYYLDSKT